MISLYDRSGYSFKVCAHLRHEPGVVGGPVTWDQRGEECRGHVKRLNIFPDVRVPRVSQNVNENCHNGQKHVIKKGPVRIVSIEIKGKSVPDAIVALPYPCYITPWEIINEPQCISSSL